MRELAVKFIRGGYGLALTFWVFLGLFSFFLNLVFIGILPVLLNKYSVSVPIVQVLGILVAQAYTVLAIIATWNAASLYQGKKIWAVLAQILALLDGLQVVGIIFVAISAYFA